MELKTKLEKLKTVLAEYTNLVVMFSGGIDSSLLLYICQKFFPEKLKAITILSATLSAEERTRIEQIVSEIDVEHHYLVSKELENREFVLNDAKRCYYCKKIRLEQLQQWVKNFPNTIFLDGSNTDDLQDYRPGMLAVQEFPGLLISPFLLAGFDKQDIRQLAKQMGIKYWDLPSSACLASRLAYGLEITVERLRQVEQIEKYLATVLTGTIRVRHHGDLARIELNPENFSGALEENLRKQIVKYCKEAGFSYVTLDLQGYQLGSMNRVIER